MLESAARLAILNIHGGHMTDFTRADDLIKITDYRLTLFSSETVPGTIILAVWFGSVGYHIAMDAKATMGDGLAAVRVAQAFGESIAVSMVKSIPLGHYNAHITRIH